MGDDKGDNEDSAVRSVVRIPLQKIASKVLRSDESTSSHNKALADDPSESVADEKEQHQNSTYSGNRWELLSSLLESGDRAKSNVIKLIGREIRQAIEALELHKDVLSLLQNHSLEIHASLHLKPLTEVSTQPSSTTDEDNVDNHVDEHIDPDLD